MDEPKSLGPIMDIVAMTRYLGVSIEFDWDRLANAFEITVRKGKIIDRFAISTYELDNIIGVADYIKSAIKRCATEVNSAYERSTLE